MPDAGYVYDPLYLEHGVAGHPESPERLRAIMTHLEQAGLLGRMSRIEPRDATLEDLLLVHEQSLIDHVRQLSTMDERWIDMDTYVVKPSYAAALRAAGGVLAAIDAVLDGAVDSAFCLVRPPGHHATRDHAMGFCLFNNVALGAAHALERRGLERAAIIDFDVHHGNGTQDIFGSEPRLLYF